MTAHYPIRAVSKLTGISPDTLRAWERRYGAVQPARAGRGRQYGEQEVERLRRLSRLVGRGHAIGSIASLDDAALDALLDAGPAPPSASSRPHEDLIAPIVTAVSAFDANAAQDELTRLAALLPPREFVHAAVLPLMREVGAQWHARRLTVAQEHLVSHLLRNILGTLVRLCRPAAASRRLVAATPSGERHEFGILAASMLAATAGVDVVYLGADLPADDTARAARRVAASAILYGITIEHENTLDEIRGVVDAMPATTELWLGGAAAATLDVTSLSRPVTVLPDLPAFEDACRRWTA